MILHKPIAHVHITPKQLNLTLTLSASIFLIVTSSNTSSIQEPQTSQHLRLISTHTTSWVVIALLTQRKHQTSYLLLTTGTNKSHWYRAHGQNLYSNVSTDQSIVALFLAPDSISLLGKIRDYSTSHPPLLFPPLILAGHHYPAQASSRCLHLP